MSGWKVRILTQSTIQRCWEATGHMLWQWRKGSGPKLEESYRLLAGRYATLDTGLVAAQMTDFYKRLGIRSLAKASGANVRHALKWTPVVVTSVEQLSGHAMVVLGVTGTHYKLINPCQVMAVNFDDEARNSCQAGEVLLPRSKVDAELGGTIWYW